MDKTKSNLKIVNRQEANPTGIDQATIRLWPDAGRRLGIGRAAAYQAAKRGEIPVLRIGRKLLVPRTAFERLLGGELKPAA